MSRIEAHCRLALVGLHLVWGASLVATVFPLIAHPRRIRVRQTWSRQLLSLLKLKVETTADQLANLDQGLVVANHVSFIDIFAINSVLPSGFLAKQDVAEWPLIGWMAKRNDTLFIRRGNRRAAHDAQLRIRGSLAAGKRLAVFPEGTTTDGTRLLPFNAAMFQGAIDAQAPIHVLTVEYLAADGRHTTLPAYIDDVSVMDCLKAVLSSDGLRIRITLAESFYQPLPDRRSLAELAHRAAHGVLARGAAA